MEPYANLGCTLKVDVDCDACKAKMMEVLSSICGMYSVNIDSKDGTATISAEVNPNILMTALSRSGLGNHAKLERVSLTHPQVSSSRHTAGYGYGSYNHGTGYNRHGHGHGHGYSSIGGAFRHGRSLPEYNYGYDGHHNYHYPMRGIAPDYSYPANYYAGVLPPPRPHNYYM